jgi:hypothetical protein
LVDEILPVLAEGCKTGGDLVDADVASDVVEMHGFVGELRRRASVSLERWRDTLNEKLEPHNAEVEREVLNANLVDWEGMLTDKSSYHWSHDHIRSGGYSTVYTPLERQVHEYW